LSALVGIGAPFALFFEIIAVIDIKKSKKTDKAKHDMGRAIFGIVVGSLVLVTVFLMLCGGSFLYRRYF